MPIMQLQQRLKQVGVIRLGEKRLSKNNKPYPAKLETFRLTSPARHIIEAVAEKYGGEVRDWPDAPDGPQFQVTTQSIALEVYVLPQKIDPNLELWGNRHKVRHCNGVTEKIRNIPCMCEAAARARYQKAGIEFPEDGRFGRDPRADCKPTTRVSVALRDISDGQWKVEAHGWNAAAELPTQASVYLAMAQRPVPAVLRMDHRDEPKLIIENGVEKVDARKFSVPVLDFGDLFTMRQALTGGVDAAVARALESQQRQALTATAEAPSVRDWLAEIAAADTTVRLNNLKEDMQAAGVRDERIVEAWKARGADLVAAKPAPAAPKPAQAAVPPIDKIVDADVEPDADEVWAAIVREAGRAGWNLPTLEAKFGEAVGKSSSDANGWELEHFLGELKNGRAA
jgi:hypothetical protein